MKFITFRQLEQERDECQQRKEKYEAILAELGPQLRDDIKRMEERRAIVDRHETKKREFLEKINELENYEYPEYNEVDILVHTYVYILIELNLC